MQSCLARSVRCGVSSVLIDRHHGGLFRSLQLLGDRLSWDVYTPVGMDWWTEEIWNFGRSTYPDDRLAQQYLVEGQGAWLGSIRASEDVVWVKDAEFPDRWIHGITLADARKQNWTFVMATVQDNQLGFWKFAKEVGATYLLQVGNTGQGIEWSFDPLALVSSEMPIVGKGVLYHQEMEPIEYVPPKDHRSAASFVNSMPYMDASGSGCWTLLQRAQETLPIKVYGGDCPDGVVRPYSKLVETARSVGWGWHDKAQGDGFGHVIHTWAAVGRPIIGHASHYAGKMASVFWDDLITCIDLDRHSLEEAVEIVQGLSDAEHVAMCEAIRGRFEANVDYDAEAEQIRAFLDQHAAVPA